MNAMRTVHDYPRWLANALLLGILGLFLLSACHTTAGFGQDLQSAGRNIQRNANTHNK